MKTVIVTGGAKGIGRAISENLARKGYQVLINYNTSKKEAEQLKEELKDYCVEIFKADVSDYAQVKEMVTFCVGRFNTIDILINNAGIGEIKLFTDITVEDWNNMINTNLNSVFYTTKQVVPYMIRQKQGCIINISSIWGMVRIFLRDPLFYK